MKYEIEIPDELVKTLEYVAAREDASNPKPSGAAGCLQRHIIAEVQTWVSQVRTERVSEVVNSYTEEEIDALISAKKSGGG